MYSVVAAYVDSGMAACCICDGRIRNIYEFGSPLSVGSGSVCIVCIGSSSVYVMTEYLESVMAAEVIVMPGYTAYNVSVLLANALYSSVYDGSILWASSLFFNVTPYTRTFITEQRI